MSDDGIKQDWGYKTIRVRALIAYTNDGQYLIHGSHDEDYGQMAKAMAPIWDLNPSQEAIQEIEFDVELPDLDLVKKPRVKNAQD